jgi:hypothetical protein
VIFSESQEPASSFLFQPGFPADVAPPTGLVGKLKVEGDN